MTADALLRQWARLRVPADVAQRARGRIQKEPARLVFIGRAADDGQRLRLAPRAALAWRRMQAAARSAGISLEPLSAYRSVARQTRIIRRKLAGGQSIGRILRVNALPGCSEHHTGRALDFGTANHLRLEVTFARTGAFRWLKRHAWRFGFSLSYPPGNPQGITFEPWHWCWHPTRHTKVTK